MSPYDSAAFHVRVYIISFSLANSFTFQAVSATKSPPRFIRSTVISAKVKDLIRALSLMVYQNSQPWSKRA